MAYNGDGTDAELAIICLLEKILIEEKKQTYHLEVLSGTSLDDEDIVDECN